MRRIRADNVTQVRIDFEGETLLAHEGDTIAAALLAGGHRSFRTTAVSGSPRGPFCMMGVCFDCLVEVDGIANRQACLIAVREGMRIRRQAGAIDIAGDPSSGSMEADAP